MRLLKFYVVHIYTGGGNSGGYMWFTSRKAAAKAKRDADAEDPDETPADLDTFHVVPTKAGILDALKRRASHPDNG